ncbi:MAG: AMP-binding protein [Ilumatobacter sp.]|uniref:AMP-binding protein n=1 Tax=Ilumatobacter sp. TaxID=1967498 RepID=UPI0026318328|nr:AMP-binding protein [Ilumatobacter sp.]MDJ0769578.1 AMP-binding protein [Ilumatobacter sp.]
MTRPQRRTLVDGVDPDALAIVGPDRSLTWSELEVRGRRLANALDAAGFGPGNVWSVLLHNRSTWAEIAIGNARAGSRYVPLNWHLTPRELADLLVDSGARLVLTEPDLLDRATEAARLAGVDRIVVVGDEFEAWLGDADDEPPSERQIGTPLLYTGGTTGRSKGVTRSDRDADASDWARLWGGWGRLVRMPTDGRTLTTTPLYHALGMAALVSSLASGVPAVIERRFSPKGMLASIERHGITSMAMVPTQFVRLLKLGDDVRMSADVSSLRWVLHTAAPCPEWAERAMIEWWGPVIYEMYGASEGAGPAICDSHEWLERPGTVGRASAAVEYSIVDDDGDDLPTGAVGTIYCRRSDGAPEYYGDPEKTSASRLPDGRFTVGDVGWLDEDGYLFLADRRVDLILVGGSNVYPAEIEAVLVEHPGVGDAAVFGIPDPDMGEQIKAVIEPVDGDVGAVDLDAVRAFAADRLAAFKLPTSYDVVEALPREAHGKLKKRLLRDPYWE